LVGAEDERLFVRADPREEDLHALPFALADFDVSVEVGFLVKFAGFPSWGGPLMKVWKMLKNKLPFFGTMPFLRMPAGSMRTSAPLSTRGQCARLWFRLRSWGGLGRCREGGPC